jgi:imidazolonepropionase-like amidohydrolase
VVSGSRTCTRECSKRELYAAVIDEAHKLHLRGASHVYYEQDAQKMVYLGLNVIAHGVLDLEITDSTVAEMGRKHGACIPAALSIDKSAVACEKRPEWLRDPFFRTALEPRTCGMITTEKYKQTVKDSEFGMLKPGLKANFIMLNKDPSADIKNPQTIVSPWKNGKRSAMHRTGLPISRLK